MAEVVIADASCLIALTNINRLDLLAQVYQRVWITSTIAAEFGLPLPTWVRVVALAQPVPDEVVRTRLDPGESSALALALEIRAQNPLLILDDRQARRIVEQRFSFRITGTAGVVSKAKQKGLITAVRPLLEKLQAAGLRLSPTLIENLCREVGE